MKIIYYSTAYHASHGGSNHSKSFVEWCKKNKDINEITVFPSKEILKQPLVSSVRKKDTLISALRKNALATIFRFLRRSDFYLMQLFEEIKSHKPDAIVIRLDSNFLQVTKLKKEFPQLIVATEVNASPFDESFKGISFRAFFRALERKSLANADINFFVSKTLRDKIMGSLSNESRDIILPNGVDTSLFVPSPDKAMKKRDLDLPVEKIVIGYVGTLDISKRMNILIEAYGTLCKRREDIYFVIVGDGPSFLQTQEEIVKNNLTDFVRLTGNIPHVAVPKYLQAFDVAIHHAANDYMCPLKLFEYFAAGVPAVGPDTPAVKEIFENGRHLFLCQPEAEDIVKQLNKYLDDMSAAAHIVNEARKLVTEKYTWQINADTVVAKIKSISHK